jgi:hypothetical protein
MEKELVSELAAQPKEGKKKPPTIKEKKDISNRKKKNPITKNKKNKQTTTTTTTTKAKCERQPKTTQVSLHKVKLVRTNNKTYTRFFTKQIIL